MSKRLADPVAKRYAEAFFSLAQRRGCLTEVSADLRRLSTELAVPAVRSFLLDTRVELNQRRAKIGPLLEGFHELTQNLVNLVFDKRREQLLQNLPEAFRRCEMQAEGAVEGVVESPTPLGSEELARLSQAFGQVLGKRVQLENQVDSELLAGVRVTVDNRMVDYSAQGRLEGLRRKMLETPLPSAS